MDKTIGYWIETLSGYISAVIIMYFSFENWEKLEFIKSVDFLDKIIFMFPCVKKEVSKGIPFLFQSLLILF